MTQADYAQWKEQEHRAEMRAKMSERMYERQQREDRQRLRKQARQRAALKMIRKVQRARKVADEIWHALPIEAAIVIAVICGATFAMAVGTALVDVQAWIINWRADRLLEAIRR